MYAGVPANRPLTVSGPYEPSAAPSAEPLTRSCCVSPECASPKSITRTRPSPSIMTLSGLKSRWTSPFAWAAARPSPAAQSAAKICSRERGSANHCVSVTPSTCSITMYATPLTSKLSWTATTLGWASFAIALASRTTLRWTRTSPGSRIFSTRFRVRTARPRLSGRAPSGLDPSAMPLSFSAMRTLSTQRRCVSSAYNEFSPGRSLKPGRAGRDYRDASTRRAALLE